MAQKKSLILELMGLCNKETGFLNYISSRTKGIRYYNTHDLNVINF